MTEAILFKIDDASQVGETRRATAKLARESGFSENDEEKAAIIATELASNLIKHAGGGQLIVQSNKPHSIEIFALDKGAGIKNIGESLRDGHSTAGSAGQGLGAAQRLASDFDIFSQPNRGTVARCEISAKADAPHLNFTVGAISLPHPKETVCGDGWATKEARGVLQILVVDGLGHGREARRAAQAAIEIFNRESAVLPPVETLENIHQGIAATRGAAVAVVNLDAAQNAARFAGVGNISGVIVGDEQQRQMVSHAGIVGHKTNKIAEFVYEWQPDSVLIAHSDGLQTRWNLDAYPGIRLRQPSLIAALLYRDFSRGNDDVTVLAIRQNERKNL